MRGPVAMTVAVGEPLITRTSDVDGVGVAPSAAATATNSHPSARGSGRVRYWNCAGKATSPEARATSRCPFSVLTRGHAVTSRSGPGGRLAAQAAAASWLMAGSALEALSKVLARFAPQIWGARDS